MSFHIQQKLPYLHIDREWGMPSGQVHALALTNDDTVWMATPAGLASYDGIRVDTFTKSHGLSTHGLRTVYCFDGEELFVGTDINLDHSLPGRSGFEPLINADNWKYGFIECLLRNENGTFWLGTPTGLYLYTPASDSKKSNTRLYLQGFIKDICRTESGKFGFSENHSVLLNLTLAAKLTIPHPVHTLLKASKPFARIRLTRSS